MIDSSNNGFDFFVNNCILKYVDSPVHRTVIIDIFREHWNKFYVLPASKTGKYHHRMENIIPFGMVNHIMRATYFANHLIKEENVRKHKNDILTAVLLHDIGNIVIKSYNDYTIHGLIGAQLVSEKLSILDASPLILLMIQNHMHHWQGNEMIGIPDRIVAYADYLASLDSLDISDIIYLTTESVDKSPVITDIDEHELLDTNTISDVYNGW